MEVPKIRRRGIAAPGFPRRVATAPSALQSRHSDSSSAAGLVETLYSHPNAKIVSFTASARSLTYGGADVFSSAADDEPGTLSWLSQLERTIAVGAFRIYRAPGSVAFLSSGSALQPILPKSQCWCIDEENSKFVLPIRRPNYWRIELPVFTQEDRERAVAFRGVLDRILQFEKTECPFKRSFTVELPEPQGPIIKKPWKPVPRPPSSPSEEVTMFKAGKDKVPSEKPSLVESTVEIHALTTGEAVFSSSEPYANAGLGIRNSESEITNSPYSEEHRLDLDSLTTVAARVDLLDIKGTEKPSFFVSQPNETASATVVTGEPSSSLASASCDHLPGETAAPQQDRNQHRESVHDGHLTDPCLEPKRADATAGAGGNDPDEPLRHVPAGTAREPTVETAEWERTTAPGLSRISTSPPELQVTTPSPSKSKEEPRAIPKRADLLEGGSPTGSYESFHSVQSWHSPITPLPPSPPSTSRSGSSATFPYPHDNIAFPDRISANQGTSNAAVVNNDRVQPWEMISNEDDESSGGSLHESIKTASETYSSLTQNIPGSFLSDEEAEWLYGPDESRLAQPKERQTDSSTLRHRHPSPLPPAATLYTPLPTAARLRRYWDGINTVKGLPGAIIVKTCEILLGPPAHLITLMLKVAARISSGEWKGQAFGYDEHGETIPVQWDYSEGDYSDWSDDDEMHEGKLRRRQNRARPAGKTSQGEDVGKEGKIWDVD